MAINGSAVHVEVKKKTDSTNEWNTHALLHISKTRLW